MTAVTPSVGMYVPLIDLTQLPSAQNVRATVTSILALSPAPAFSAITGKPTTLAGYGITDAQPLDADLTAIAALATTAYGRDLLVQVDAAAVRTYIGVGAGTGTVTSVGLVGTANQITVSGASPIVGAGSFTLSFPAGGVTLPGTTTGAFSGALTGNASTATALQTARTINGTSFDGTANITVTASAGTLTGTTLAAGVTASSLLSAAGGSFGTAAFTAASAYQPIDADLTSIAALTTTAYGRDFLVQVDAASARAYIGAGTGVGTVTSFSSGDLSPLFTTSVATATTTPALSFTISTQAANLVFAGPASGGVVAPTFRSLVAADIPDISGTYQLLDAALTALATGSDFVVFSGPATSNKTFTLPNASATILTDNAAVAVAQGGTGVATLTGLLQGNGTSAITGITNSSTVGQVLRVTGASTYAWGAVDLADTDAVTGTLPIVNGGTGLTSYTEGDLIYGNGGGTLSKLAEPGLPGYVLSWAANTPVATQLSTIAVTSITGTANQVIASASTGSVTLSLPQSIHTGATPQFAAISLGVTPSGVGFLIDTKSTGSASNINFLQGEAFMATLVRNARSNLAAPLFRFDKARGDLTTPADVANGDALGAILFQGFSNSTYDNQAASVQATVTGVVAGTTVPTSIDLFTRETTALALKARLSAAGNWLVGTTADPTGSGKIVALGIENTPIGATTQSTVASTTLQATTSILQGGGMKHQRVTTGSIGAGSTALITLTWTATFADANYTAVASVVEATTSSLSLSVVHIESVSASAVAVRIINNAAGSLTGELQVIAMRD